VQRARKSLGQNFLIDPNLQRKIVEAVDPGPEDTVIEIGPGRGALTRHLTGRVARLIAVEKDESLADGLNAELGKESGFTLIRGDALETDFASFSESPARTKIVGNIPYNITTPLVFHLLERRQRPASIVLMVQREVADRILAAPGVREYGALTVGVRSVASAEKLFHVGRSAFRPVPNVDSTVLRITPYRPPPLTEEEEEDLRDLTRITFSMRRKQMQKILRTAPGYGLEADALSQVLDATGIGPESRPETVSPERFILLARALRSLGLPNTHINGDARRQVVKEANAGAGKADERHFIGLVAHELRSPVAAIIGYAELLADGVFGQVDDRAREGLGRIGSAARQLRTLIDGLEILLGQGDPDTDLDQQVDPVAEVREAVAEAGIEAALRSIAIVLDSPDQVAPIRTDPEMLGRTLDLVLAATLKTGPRGPITITLQDGNDALELSIRGADEFDDALTDDPSALTSGTGFRIALARRLVRALRGELRVAVGDDGTTIHLRLPRN
jgi:16S rRNA (adenine1518-N6/adenine1519-N6)-dimethyltransferase